MRRVLPLLCLLACLAWAVPAQAAPATRSPAFTLTDADRKHGNDEDEDQVEVGDGGTLECGEEDGLALLQPSGDSCEADEDPGTGVVPPAPAPAPAPVVAPPAI